MKKMLELSDPHGTPILIDANVIYAIERIDNHSCRVFCFGFPEGFVINKPYGEIFEKMKSMNIVELVKF
jgi:hypothetical protein